MSFTNLGHRYSATTLSLPDTSTGMSGVIGLATVQYPIATATNDDAGSSAGSSAGSLYTIEGCG